MSSPGHHSFQETLQILHQLIPSWWFQPIWKICSSNRIISPGIGENKTCLKPPPRDPEFHYFHSPLILIGSPDVTFSDSETWGKKNTNFETETTQIFALRRTHVAVNHGQFWCISPIEDDGFSIVMLRLPEGIHIESWKTKIRRSEQKWQISFDEVQGLKFCANNIFVRKSIGSHLLLEPQTTSFKWMEMVISNHFLLKKMVHHPIDSQPLK